MRRLLSLISLTALPLPLWAAECAIDPLAKFTALGGDPADSQIHVEADSSESDYATANFEGSVKVRQGDKHLFAPKITYQRDSSMLQGSEGITVATPTIAAQGKNGEYHIADNIITFAHGDYYIKPKANGAKSNGASGSVENAVINRKTNIDQLEDITWSTCGRTDPVWSIKAKNLTLDYNSNRGAAKNATFRVKDTPIFWTPYFSFPLNNERATGFLTPSISTSEERGFELQLPFYWNIAPNQDATLTLHPMSKRGLMLDGKWRYLDKKQTLYLGGAYLPDDIADSHNARWRINAHHTYQFTDNWQSDIDYQNVSDINYINDINGGLYLYDSWYLDRHARLNGKGDWGNAMLQVQDYKRVSSDVTEDETPYARLPQLTYSKSWTDGKFNYQLGGEAVRFYKYDNGSANRFTLNGEAGYRLSSSWGYIEPKLSINARHYQFNPKNHQFRNGHKTIVLPTFSLDTGATLERGLNIGADSYTQTLEPRFFYLYTPYRRQNDIPSFDSVSLSKSWNWLFARNRFAGSDRIGDANQLTTAITTRFYRNSDGQEKLRLSLGQIQYFADRHVNLNNNGGAATTKSVIVTEGKYQIDQHWSLYGLSFWDPNQHRNDRDVIDIRYNLDPDRYIQFGHHYNRTDYDQISLGSGWKIKNDWRLFGRYDYSLRYNHGINLMAGVEYNSCCWAWRLAGRRYRSQPEDAKNHNVIYLEFIFKGLGSMGSNSGAMLHDQLSNFHPLPQENTL